MDTLASLALYYRLMHPLMSSDLGRGGHLFHLNDESKRNT